MATAAEMLTAVESAILAITNGQAVQEYRIGNHNVRRMPLSDLIAWRDKLRNQIAIEAGTTVVLDGIPPQGGADPTYG